MLKRPSYFLVLIVALFLAGGYITFSQEGSETGQAITTNLSVGDVPFSFRYSSNWRLSNLEEMNNFGAALVRIEANDLGLQDSIAGMRLFLVESNRAIGVFDDTSQFPLEIAELHDDLTPFVLDERDAALLSGRIVVDDLEMLLLSLQVGENLFIVSQAIFTDTLTEELREEIYAILSSVIATPPVPDTETPVPTLQFVGQAPEECLYKVTVQLTSLRVINAEEAGGGRDFGGDGDQISLLLELGPPQGENQVNAGARGEFRINWTANIFAGDTIEPVTEMSRDVCSSDFAFVLQLREDDSNPFDSILTPLGEQVYVPLIAENQPLEFRPEIFANFEGRSQDGDYSYEIVYAVIIEEQTGVDTADLTPTLTPSNTPVPTSTPTATITRTPTNTFTPTPSDTPTPSNTPTMTYTPTASYTPSITPTPSDTLTPSITPKPSDTATPSDTPTPTDTATATNTATASRTPTITATATKTHTPTATYTASATATITNTPTETLTPSITPTPSLTPTPTAVSCPDSLPTTLYPGMFGRVAPDGDANRLRDVPSTDGTQVGRMEAGERFEVVGGPECGDGYAWIEVRYGSIVAWTATADLEVYWIIPLPGNAAFDSDACVVGADGTVNQRSEPNVNAPVVAQTRQDDLFDVVGQYRDELDFVWWNLGDGSWVREDTVESSGDCRDVPEVEP